MSTTADGFAAITLNLRFGLADDGPNAWHVRRTAYPGLFAAFAADFWAFQEANDFQVAQLAAMLPGHGVLGLRPNAPTRWQHNPIFHHPRWACLSVDHFYLSATPDKPSKDPDSRWPRQCTIGKFAADDTRVTIVNTHFDFDAAVQKRSARCICERLNADAPSAPVVVMGDFNAAPGSPAWQVFTAAGFVSALGSPAPGTFHGFSGIPDGRAIDWVLYRGPLQPHAAKVIDRPFNGVFPSDHFPVFVRWRRQPSPIG